MTGIYLEEMEKAQGAIMEHGGQKVARLAFQ